MKKFILTLIAGMAMLFGLSATAVAAEDIASLRGEHDLNKGAKMFANKKVMKSKGGFERSYELQPPMIPHSIEKDKITLKNNSCMKCHSAKNYEKEKAPKVGDSHFKDRDGKVLKKVSARRYFCNQCHALQVDASPLIDNNF
ncbi:MAG: nitrate reductase cytochrome c-type subunit [Gammaproteobacteria bacterium]|nr:nitrate reductase cytochrome c-type subunit [Gammaproteobacteria bacterium]